MDRREFISDFSLALSLLAPFVNLTEVNLVGRLNLLTHRIDRSNRSEWARLVRQQFLLDDDIIHLNCGSIGATPTLVVDAIVESTRQLEANPFHHQFGDGIYAGVEKVREDGAQFFGVDLNEIAIVENTTSGMNALAQGLQLQRDDEVLTTNHEHPGGMTCWQHLASRDGVVVRYVHLDRSTLNPQTILERTEAMITPRTRAFSFCHIDTITGMRMPIESLAHLARERGIFFVCDGAQSAGMFSVDINRLGVDAYVCSGHKWLLGPKGTGWLFLRKASQERCRAAELKDFSVYSATKGTKNLPNVIGLLASLKFLESIGLPNIEREIVKLANHLKERLKRISGVTLLTPDDPELSGGIVTATIDPNLGSSFQLSLALSNEHRAFVRPAQITYSRVDDPDVPRENYNAIRFSTHIFNSESEIDRVADILEGMLKV